MSVVLPFRGLRLDQEKGGPIASFLAPPYDVVSQQERDRIVAASDHNIFSLELPSGSEGHPGAASLLDRWLREGILSFDDSPCLYPYDIEFEVKGKGFRRRGFVAAVKIEPWENRVIRPHELTFSRVTSDRLSLLEHTRTQFSQIFLLYRGNPVPRQVMEAAGWEQLCEVADQSGNTHLFGRLGSREMQREICCSFSGIPLYIADGHHRYTTALEYRNIQVQRHGDPPTMPYLYQMAYLVDADDPGLVVLPTHRIVSIGSTAEKERMAEKAASLFRVTEIQGPRVKAAAAAEEEVAGTGSMALGVVCGWKEGGEIWRLRPEARQEFLDSALPPQLAGLDVSMFDRVVMKEVLGLDADEAEAQGRVAFDPDAREAAASLDKDQVLFVMRPTPAHQVLDVADAGLTMPHKSTFFYPKILTGLVMNSVDPERPVELLEC